MDEKSYEDLLDRQLREAAPYIEDAGFTARVLTRLPAPRRKTELARPLILIGATLLASLLAYILSEGGRFVWVDVTRLSALPPVWLFVLIIASGFSVMGGGFAAAMSKMHSVQS